MQEQCQRIREKVAEARVRYAQGGLGKVDGADAHQFQLEPPLTEEELTACETEISVKLPAELRAFLLHVGSGGAGPDSGIFKVMGSTIWWLRPREHLRSQESIRDLQMPCVLREGLTGNWVLKQFGTDWSVDTASAEPCPFAGTIFLVYYGGAQCDVLVLNGPYTGRVCWIDEQIDGDYSMPPVFAPEANFLDWYEAWIDLILTGADVNYGLRLAQTSAAMGG